jgi:hypothetical protein
MHFYIGKNILGDRKPGKGIKPFPGSFLGWPIPLKAFEQ